MRKSKARHRNGAEFADVSEALEAMSAVQWQKLNRLAEHLLNRLRADSRMQQYLAGISGAEIVHTAVLAVEQGGRAVKPEHLKCMPDFYEHLQQIVRSTVDNFNRHQGSRVVRKSLCAESKENGNLDPADSNDIETDIAIRDLVNVVLPRVFSDLANKPKQLHVLKSWVESLGKDDILPDAGQTKFVRHLVRATIRKHLKELVASDLKILNPTGKELLR